jgi:hypothetical protein
MSENSKTDKIRPHSNQNSPNSRRAFSRITSDLKSAIDEWETLSAKAPKLSAEERRFKDMQKLLKELRDKMKKLNFI